MPDRLLPLVPRWRSLVNAMRLVRNPIPLLMENVDKYGKTYSFHVGGMKKGILSTEPELIRHILQKNHRNYTKSGLQTDVLKLYLGEGLLTSEGEFWLSQRRLIQPAFHKERLKALVDLMLQEINLAMDEVLALKGNEVNIYSVMNALTFRIIVKTIFSTGISEEKMLILSRNITQIQGMITRQIRQPYLRPWFAVSGRIKRHLRKASQSRAILREMILERQKYGQTREDLLQMMLDARYEDGGRMSEEQILDESMILFVAGHETSANALTWALYMLTQHPEHIERLRTEWSGQKLGPADAALNPKGWPHTKMVLNEVMRIYPPAWIVDRLSIGQDEIAGFKIPASTFFILFIYGVHHDPDLWPEPERFLPDRFSPENEKAIKAFSFFPFGGGPRLCIGNHFAMLEMQLILRAFVERFDPLLVPGQEIMPMPLVTLRPKSGIRLCMRERN